MFTHISPFSFAQNLLEATLLLGGSNFFRFRRAPGRPQTHGSRPGPSPGPWGLERDRGAPKRFATTATTRRRGTLGAASSIPPRTVRNRGRHAFRNAARVPLATGAAHPLVHPVARRSPAPPAEGPGPAGRPAPPTALRPARFRIDRSDRDEDSRPGPASQNRAASCPWGQTGRPDDAPKHGTGGRRTSSPSGGAGKAAGGGCGPADAHMRPPDPARPPAPLRPRRARRQPWHVLLQDRQSDSGTPPKPRRSSILCHRRSWNILCPGAATSVVWARSDPIVHI